MANLGSSTTPIKGEQFQLPDGHSFDVDNGDLVWKDSSGSIFARYDEGNSEFVIDSISATSVSADSGKIDTLEATTSFTDPAGNTYTGTVGKSDSEVSSIALKSAIAADFMGL